MISPAYNKLVGHTREIAPETQHQRHEGNLAVDIDLGAKTVLVTGGTGSIGYAIVELKSRGGTRTAFWCAGY
jgi:FlaA1/EpsC-like NDP-sugar epimerase